MKNKKVLGYEEFYIVNSLGYVYSIDRLVNGCNNSKRMIKGRKIKTFTDSGGYKKITLYKNNKRKKCVYLHRIVAGSFYGEIHCGMEVNHKDGDKSNNKPSNLEIVTRKENFNHAVNNGLFIRTKNGTWGKV